MNEADHGCKEDACRQELNADESEEVSSVAIVILKEEHGWGHHDTANQNLVWLA